MSYRFATKASLGYSLSPREASPTLREHPIKRLIRLRVKGRVWRTFSRYLGSGYES